MFSTATPATFHWETDGRKVELTKLNVRGYGGTATGTATLPLDPKAAGAVDLRLTEINVKKVAKDFALPLPFEGKVNGSLQGSLAASDEGGAAKLNVNVEAAKVRVQNIPAERLKGTLNYQNGALDYHLEGRTLGGAFDLAGEVPPDKLPGGMKAKKGRLSIKGVQLDRLFSAQPRQSSPPGRRPQPGNELHA